MANISYGVNIIPKTNNTYTLGNSDYKWFNIYTTNLIVENTLASPTSTASGPGAVALGYNTTASKTSAHSEGGYTTASGQGSHAEGSYTIASAASAHAEGTHTTASAASSHAEGIYTTCYNEASHASGIGTTATGVAANVFGLYNVEDTTTAYDENTTYNINDVTFQDHKFKKYTSNGWVNAQGNYVEIVGNGIDENNKSNARALDWNGNEYLKGDIYVGCNADSSSGTKLIKATDIASGSTAGIVRVDGQGILANSSGQLSTIKALSTDIKAGENQYKLIVPYNQHEATFYGLATAAGDSTQALSSNSVGTYTNTAKRAIGAMLGYDPRPWEYIIEDTFTNQEEADYIITTDGNGNPFDLTDIAFFFETPKSTTMAASKGSYGQVHFYYGQQDAVATESGAWTQEINGTAHGFHVKITQEPGGLFLCEETATTTSSNSAAWRTRFATGFNGIYGMRYLTYTRHFTKINIKTVKGTGHFVLLGKRA